MSFTTSRIARWRAEETRGSFLKTLDRIESTGLEVWSVGESSSHPDSFSYTVGVFDTCGQPELLSVALAPSGALKAMNRAAELLREGADLTHGPISGILGNVDVVFRPVDPKWLPNVMLRTNWYYGGEAFPVLQLIYPDAANRFPWDDDFDSDYAQPLLQPGQPEGELERRFWYSNEPKSDRHGLSPGYLADWPFPDDPHTNSYLTKTVNDGEEPVTYVSHDADDGAWQFLGDKMSDGGGPVLSCLHHPIDKDPTLRQLHDLPHGWYAMRDHVGAPWKRFESPAQEDEPDADGQPD
ncbi:protein of unknown function [Bryocella elongata]|uniref:DUF4262 domain-containing protein n=1 Tax=Bryocella elongata TaxID=863522 RepID=A0A1H6AI86_9BACT|nr:DUF4262 domain-containing protein [Bryocella elongata]SEG48469.1 protein of unknown function [Bryocella elongata]